MRKFIITSILITGLSNVVIIGATITRVPAVSTEILTFNTLAYIVSVFSFLILNIGFHTLIKIRLTDELEGRTLFLTIPIAILAQVLFFIFCEIYRLSYDFELEIPSSFKYELSSNFSWITCFVLSIMNSLVHIVVSKDISRD